MKTEEATFALFFKWSNTLLVVYVPVNHFPTANSTHGLFVSFQNI